MEEKIQQDIKPEDVAKVIADLAKLGYKVEKEKSKKEIELERLERELEMFDIGSPEPTEEELIELGKQQHPYFSEEREKKRINDRIKELTDGNSI